MPAAPRAATIVDTFTIAPRPRAAICGASAAVRKNGARKFTAAIASKPASVVSALGPSSQNPALLTSTSTSPASAARRRTSSGEARSARMKRPPVSAATSWPRASSRPLTTTFAPRSPNNCAVARPMPDVPPVTSTVACSKLI